MAASRLIAPTWRVIDRPDGARCENAMVHEQPDVMLEVRGYPKGVERLIYAVFHWPNIKPQALPLYRDIVAPDLHAFADSKSILFREWMDEHAAWEVPVLEEMWRRPTMTNTEVAALKAKHKRAAQEAKERAQALARAGRLKKERIS